ncbi:MAG: PAS domain S-box protein [Candidatus Hodarchaeota archaeon]
MSIIQEYNNHLEEIFENSYSYIYLHDKAGNIIDVNDVVIKKLGYSKEEILSLNAIDFLSIEENVVEIQDLMAETVQTGKVKEPRMYKVKKKNGDLIYIEINTIPLKKNGEIYAILGIGHDVTEFKKVELKLRESEEKYRHLFKESPFGILIFDNKGNLIESNKALLKKLSEYATEDFSEKNFLEIISYFKNKEQLIRLFNERFKAFREGMDLDPIEFFLITKKERKIWLNWQSSKFKTGNESFIQVIINDITEKKLAEEKLRESEEKFKALFMGSPVPTLTWQKVEDDFLLIDYNKALEEYSLDDIKRYLKVLGSIFFQNRPDILKDLHRCFNDKINITRELKYYVNVLEEERDLSIQFAYIPPDLVLMHVDDITERRKSEKELKESEEKYRSLFENMNAGFAYHKVITDDNNKPIDYEYIEVNPAFEKLTGLKKEDLIGKRVTVAIPGTENDPADWVGKFGNVGLTGIPLTVEDYSEALDRWYKVSGYSPEKGFFAIIFTDITDKKDAEKLIIEENRRLLELQELRKDLIIRVSHELKTPMTSIYGANQILTQLYLEEIGKNAQKYIEIGFRGSIRMKQLIENLLDVSRLDAKKLDLKLQNENLIEIIIDCVKDMKYLATNRQLKIILELPEQLYLDIDKLRFRQVLSNIISNAIKNTAKEGRIFITLGENPDYVDIHIRDTGIGLTEKEKLKLFEKFGKIERYGKDLDVDIEGSGLGLYIAKEIVELHGGRIIVESEGRFKGSTFTIRLFKKLL